MLNSKHFSKLLICNFAELGKTKLIFAELCLILLNPSKFFGNSTRFNRFQQSFLAYIIRIQQDSIGFNPIQ